MEGIKKKATPKYIKKKCCVEQPKCLLINEWKKKIWYMYTMEYYSVIESNEIVPFVEMWMDPEIVVQSEVSQKEKNKYHILTHICEI